MIAALAGSMNACQLALRCNDRGDVVDWMPVAPDEAGNETNADRRRQIRALCSRIVI
jgi:hypothetical protein